MIQVIVTQLVCKYMYKLLCSFKFKQIQIFLAQLMSMSTMICYPILILPYLEDAIYYIYAQLHFIFIFIFIYKINEDIVKKPAYLISCCPLFMAYQTTIFSPLILAILSDVMLQPFTISQRPKVSKHWWIQLTTVPMIDLHLQSRITVT